MAESEGRGAKGIREKFDKAYSASQKAGYDYWLNRSFVFGEQWLFHNPITNRLEEYPRDEERVRVTDNQMWPASRTLMAKLLRRDLIFEVPANGQDDANVKASQKALAALNDTYIRHDWEEKLRVPLTWDVWFGGTAGICVEWDPEAGDTLEYNDDGRKTGTGDTRETPLSVLEMFFEPGAPDAETARWWIKAQALPPEQVRDLYNLDKTPSTDANATLTPLQTKLLGDTSGEKLTLVLTYYERPNSETKNGMYAVVVGDKIVEGPHPWPFPFKERLNVVVAHETPVSNRWFGETVLSAARPMQVLLNMTQSVVAEHMKLAGNARILVPEESLDLIEEATDTPGEWLPYNTAAGAPEYMTPPVMPNWWMEQPDRIKQSISDLLSLQDVSRGIAPPNIESGLGISILSENNDTPLSSFARSVASAFERLGHLVLKIYEDKVTETRTASVPSRLGPRLPPESKQWRGKELMGNCHVEIPDDAIVPRSRAVSEQRAYSMWDRGIVKDPLEFARLAEMPNVIGFVEGINPDLARAERENYYMSIGRVALPAPYDMHDIHIQAHNRFRKSVTYEELPDEQRQVIDEHVTAHEVMASQEAATMSVAGEVDPMAQQIPTAAGMERVENYAAEQMVPPAGAPQPPAASSGAPQMPMDPFSLPDEAGLGPNPYGI